MLINGSDRSICFGSVGVESASFCIRSECRVKAHVGHKAKVFEESDCFIARVSGSTVFAEPSVREEQVPLSVQTAWKDKQWSLQRWVREFQAVTNADDPTATREDIKVESKLLAEAEAFRTPSKKRKGDKGTTELKSFSSLTRVSHQRAPPEVGSLGIGDPDRSG